MKYMYFIIFFICVPTLTLVIFSFSNEHIYIYIYIYEVPLFNDFSWIDDSIENFPISP